MIINRQAKWWIIISVAIFVIATAAYAPYSRSQLNGPSGGSWPGIAYAIVGFAMMLFALLLGARKKVRTLRIGRAHWWMQGHIWFGLLSYPIILYHAGFRWGGLMTQVLMWTFTIVVISGIVGLILQQFIPSVILRRVPMESTYENHATVLEALRAEANNILRLVEQHEQEAFEMENIPAGSAVATVAASQQVTHFHRLAQFFELHIEPYLRDVPAKDSAMASELSAGHMFDEMQRMLPVSMHEAVSDLREIVEERRQIARHRKFYHWLHAWLFVHVPLSYALILLGAVHAVVALRYTL